MVRGSSNTSSQMTVMNLPDEVEPKTDLPGISANAGENGPRPVRRPTNPGMLAPKNGRATKTHRAQKSGDRRPSEEDLIDCHLRRDTERFAVEPVMVFRAARSHNNSWLPHGGHGSDVAGVTRLAVLSAHSFAAHVGSTRAQ